MKFVIGIDYGTDSCRGVLVNANTGEQVIEKVFYYPRWAKKMYCNPDKQMYRQHPLDYIEGLEYILSEISKNVDQNINKNIVGISVDTTGSTPCVVDEKGMPLALRHEFKDNPNAMFILWKDHTAIKEAERINLIAKQWETVDYTQYIGSVYSSEWYFAKLLHIFKEDKDVMNAFGSFVEHCDFIPAYLTGINDVKKIKRSRCAAGHKAMWHEEYNGLPCEEFFAAINPLLSGVREKLYTETYTTNEVVGEISPIIAKKTGLPEGIKIGVGAFDCHVGAVGGNIHTKALVKVVGTSTCDIVIKDTEEVEGKLIKGICGQVDGSVIPGKIGMEAGQSAFGDFYAWYKNLLSWVLKFIEDKKLKQSLQDKILIKLEEEAAKIEPSGLLTIDWINGRRTPYANQKLKAAIMGMDLGTDAAKIYRSIVESTVFGAKAIVDRFKEENIELDEIIAIGGVAKKSQLAMQIMADVTNMKVSVASSDQTVAVGAACFAAVVGGVYETVEEAQKVIASDVEAVYYPNPCKVEIYKKYYSRYIELGKILENKFY